MKKKDFLNLFFLTILVLIIVFTCIYPDNMFGSATDWGSQHTMLPEYFRTLFYETGDLFPDFMMNLGAGQNIYNISYYGLFNPIVLISYFFPFIKMVDFMIIATILTVLLSIYLFYYWLLKKGFNRTIAMTSTIIFTCASPLIFHAHRHIMFITYMPFLILGLIGIDRYFEKQKRSLVTLSTLGMILTSYYYSIGGILVFVVYGVYCYLKKETKITIKNFFKDGFQFLYPIFLGIGLSAILLVPTAYVILNGRTTGSSTDFLNLFIPHLDINALVYGSYTIGLTALAMFALIHTFFTKKKEHIFLGSCLLAILALPIIMYVLNGMLYVRAKALIPFLPLFVLLIAFLLRDTENKKSNIKLEIVVLILFAFFWSFRGYHQNWFYLDLGLVMVYLYAYHKWQKKFLYVIPIVVLSISMVFVTNKSESYETKENYQTSFSKDKVELIDKVLQQDSDFYRFNDLTSTLLTVNKVYQSNYHTTSLYSSTYHQNYKDFFYNKMGNADTYRNKLVTSSSNNIFFDTLMNIKYVVAKIGEQPIGYELLEQKGDYGVYRNNQVYPLGYATDILYDKSYYDTLSYPYNVELLMNGVVVENNGSNEFETKIQKENFKYLEPIEGLEVAKIENGYKVVASQDIKFEIPLPRIISENEILIIKFRIAQSQNCKQGDLSITINNITNKLTCKQWLYHNGNFDFEYAISGNEFDKLSISMSKGTYEIVDIENYTLDYDTFKENSNQVDAFIIDPKTTKGDTINGSINVKKDGYFVLSIPYDEAFQMKVDGKKQEYEKVNDAFIGFPIKEGTHKIEITYEAPWKKAGMTISFISVLLFGVMIYQDKKRK